MFANPYLTAIGVPLVLICCGSLARKLARGSAWQRSDFCLGVELSLAAMAAGLVYIIDLTRTSGIQPNISASMSYKVASTASFLAICFFILLWIVSMHQDWEKRSQNPRGQFVWLVIVANLVGGGMMAAFVMLVKGV